MKTTTLCTSWAELAATQWDIPPAAIACMTRRVGPRNRRAWPPERLAQLAEGITFDPPRSIEPETRADTTE